MREGYYASDSTAIGDRQQRSNAPTAGAGVDAIHECIAHAAKHNSRAVT